MQLTKLRLIIHQMLSRAIGKGKGSEF